MPNLFSLLRGKRRCSALLTTVPVCVDHVKSLVKELDQFYNSTIDVDAGVLFLSFSYSS
jgi:hypothetical protein